MEGFSNCRNCANIAEIIPNNISLLIIKKILWNSPEITLGLLFDEDDMTRREYINPGERKHDPLPPPIYD